MQVLTFGLQAEDLGVLHLIDHSLSLAEDDRSIADATHRPVYDHRSIELFWNLGLGVIEGGDKDG